MRLELTADGPSFMLSGSPFNTWAGMSSKVSYVPWGKAIIALKRKGWALQCTMRFLSDVTYGQIWWPILGIHALHLTHPSAHTQQWTHTHTVNTHPEQWAAFYAAAPGEQLGVRCLAQRHLSRGIEGGESAVHSLPPRLQFLPAWDPNSQTLD